MSKYVADDLVTNDVIRMTKAKVNGNYYVARPVCIDGFFKRLSHAWLVIIGKADIVVWGEDVNEGK